MSALDDVARPLALWLANHALHSTLLVLLACGVAARLRSAALRGLVWRVALVGGLLTATVGGRLGSEWTRLDVGRADPAAEVASAGGAPLALEVPPAAGLDRGQRAADEGSPPAAAAELAATAPDGPASWPLVVALAWLACASFGAARWGRARRDLAALAARRLPLEDARVRARLDRVLLRSGWRGSVTLSVVDGLPSPVALGGSEIVLPTEATTLPDAALDALLAHECAHLARRDPRWLSVALLLEGVFPYLPLHRLARRRLAAEAELASDAWAARTTGEPLQLARCLAEVADWMGERTLPAPASAMARRGSELVRRVEVLVEGAPLDPAPRTLRAFTGAALIGLVAFACGAPTVSEREDGVTVTARIEEPVPADSPARVRIDRSGHALVESDARPPSERLDLNTNQGVAALRAELATVAAEMPRTSIGGLDLPAGELRIVVERGARYRYVQMVMEQCGSFDVQLWNLTLSDSPAGADAFEVPLPVDVHTSDGGETFEVRIHAKHISGRPGVRYETRIAPGAMEPEEEVLEEDSLADDFFVGRNDLRSARDLDALVARMREAYAEDPTRSLTIDARQGTVYGDVVAVLDAAIGVGFEEIVFVGSYE